jgi:chemotaxis protein methyltransferase CheR
MILPRRNRPLAAADFTLIATLLRARSGLVIGPDQSYLLDIRLQPILRREGLGSLEALAGRLRAGAAETLVRDVVEAMTTNESFFFRDGKPFAHLRAHGLPALHGARPQGVALRLWSAAAASGQEAYSIAMLIEEERPRLGDRVIEIVGTDIARAALARARAGHYSEFEVRRGLPAPLLARHFRREPQGWRIADALRARVTFREWNLLSDLRPLGRFDIVFCRNVLIYFDQPTKARVLDAVAGQMAPDGLLYLGGAETALGLSDAFQAVPGERGVYTRALRAAA